MKFKVTHSDVSITNAQWDFIKDCLVNTLKPGSGLFIEDVDIPRELGFISIKAIGFMGEEQCDLNLLRIPHMPAEVAERSLHKQESVLEAQKRAHLRSEAARWEAAVRGIQPYLVNRTPEVHKLTRLMMTASSSTLYGVLGGMETGFDITMNGYGMVSGMDPISLMEFLQFFIGHEILDDGDPGIGYYRSPRSEENTHETFVRCSGDHPDARPYFHSNIELLRKEYPDSKRLRLEDAIEIIEGYEQRRREMAASIREDIAKYGDACFWGDHARDYDDTPSQKMRAALVDEIIALGPI